MGTRVSIAALHSSRSMLEQAIGEAYQEMDRLIDLLSRHDERSAVSVLNDAGHLAHPPPELDHVLRASLAAHRLSEGAFDPKVKPLVDLLASSPAVARGEEPDAIEWREALELVGLGRVEISERRIAFEREGMGVTLDGLAKGFIVDAVAATLEAHGVRRYLVDAGGDIRAAGTREDGEPWTVGVRDPRTGSVLPGALLLRWGAVATSGGYEARFDTEGAWHHIVSARSGRSPGECLGVTVQAPHALAADALATMLLLMPPAEGARLLESLPGFEGLVIDTRGRLLRSTGWSEAAPTS
jgi:FAD:protein FMN transferase